MTEYRYPPRPPRAECPECKRKVQQSDGVWLLHSLHDGGLGPLCGMSAKAYQ